MQRVDDETACACGATPCDAKCGMDRSGRSSWLEPVRADRPRQLEIFARTSHYRKPLKAAKSNPRRASDNPAASGYAKQASRHVKREKIARQTAEANLHCGRSAVFNRPPGVTKPALGQSHQAQARQQHCPNHVKLAVQPRASLGQPSTTGTHSDTRHDSITWRSGKRSSVLGINNAASIEPPPNTANCQGERLSSPPRSFGRF